MHILLVCLGHICRSPLAEAILRDKARAAGPDWQVDNAGTDGSQPARRFTAADFQRFDKIFYEQN
jgi:low molecular weight protein-tyrosine phosphatase